MEISHKTNNEKKKKNSVADEKLITHFVNNYFTEIGPNQDKQIEKPSKHLESYDMGNFDIAQPEHPLTIN